MTALPEPNFIDREPEAIRAEIIARVEELVGEPLPPLSTERILCEQLAYRETLVRIAIQEACKQSLWAYARYPMIDYLARLLDEARQPARYATTTLLFTLPSARDVVSVIPRDSVVWSTDGKVSFITDTDVTILVGQTTGSTDATCSVAGIAGNGYLSGQLTELSPYPGFVVAVANTTTTGGGAPVETTEEMRARVPGVLATVSGAGPGDAYEALARAASSEVADAKATRPTDGVVRVTVLADSGEPGSELLELVEAALSGEDTIPLTDTVEVVGATAVEVDLELSVTLYYPQSPRTTAIVLAEVEDAAAAWVSARGRQLGSALPDSGLIHAVFGAVPELWDTTIDSELPAIGDTEFASLSSVVVNLTGYTEEPLP